MNAVTIRALAPGELAAVNRVIEAAIMSWELPERVKRLALPGYRYQQHDLDHLDIAVAVRGGEIVGVVAVETAAVRDAPAGRRALLLHGIYVLPGEQRRGIGSRLLHAAGQMARARGFDGLLVKAQAGAGGFFEKQRMTRLPVVDAGRDYERRYWLSLA